MAYGYYNNMSNFPTSYMQPVTVPTFQNPFPQQNETGLDWVEGDVGARAFQKPANWPLGKPIILWDSTDSVIFIKSWGNLGIPNPMQKLRYSVEEMQMPISGNFNQNGSKPAIAQSDKEVSKATAPDYATKEELHKGLEEIKQMIAGLTRNRNGANVAAPSPNNGNRGEHQ